MRAQIEKAACHIAGVVLTFLAALLLVTSSADAQAPPAWNDDLAAYLIGTWNLTGTIMGRPAHHALTARWILGHQFIELHERTSSNAPASETRYEALWYLGKNERKNRYVLHLLDIFGGGFSETLGFGTRIQSQLRFDFGYPDGPFLTTWSWYPRSQQWRWLMRQRGVSGKWTIFGALSMTKISGR